MYTHKMEASPPKNIPLSSVINAASEAKMALGKAVVPMTPLVPMELTRSLAIPQRDSSDIR